MKVVLLFAAIALCQLAGVVGVLFTTPNDQWYETLEKPPFNPPPWVFSPVWITLYTLMGIALFLFWRAERSPRRQTVLVVFLVHLVVNAAWSIVFFGAHQVALALGVIVLLWAMIVYLVTAGAHVDRRASMLLWPYLAWVSFAAVLNLSLLILN